MLFPLNDSLNSFSVIFGEDVAFGGVFRCTVGLADKYGMVLLSFAICCLQYARASCPKKEACALNESP